MVCARTRTGRLSSAAQNHWYQFTQHRWYECSLCRAQRITKEDKTHPATICSLCCCWTSDRELSSSVPKDYWIALFLKQFRIHPFHSTIFYHLFTVLKLTLKSSVSIRLLGTFTELTCKAGPLTLLSLELGVTHSITGWVVPSSWLSTW